MPEIHVLFVEVVFELVEGEVGVGDCATSTCGFGFEGCEEVGGEGGVVEGEVGGVG